MTSTLRTDEFFKQLRTHHECELFSKEMDIELTTMTAERDELLGKLQEAKEWSSRLADAGDDMRAERDEWKAALTSLHPTDRGTPAEMAQDIMDGCKAMREALKFAAAERDNYKARLENEKGWSQ